MFIRKSWIFLLILVPTLSRADEVELVSVEKIWDKGSHNAFTDLARWRDRWYCTFRESDAHVGGDGKLRVLESEDGKTWKSAALIAEEGIDLRDPKLSVT
ncbi:MAG TPA: exo-alpha-sialidase, partial [Isosphaeraceae bacterium]|nr:exo-alpha-sialidase [Isosphaeraceae bacterium]